MLAGHMPNRGIICLKSIEHSKGDHP
jgi:hypothetical protein